MICQLCLAKSAARHHVQESPSGRLEESHYCSDCYDAKYLKRSPDGSGLPRARFTIKTIMIVVCVVGGRQRCCGLGDERRLRHRHSIRASGVDHLCIPR
jgi:hypothetical protein